LPVDDPGAREASAEALALWDRLGSVAGRAEMLLRESEIALFAGDSSRAEGLLDEGIALCRTVDGGGMLAEAEYFTGRLAALQGDHARARRHLDQSRERFRALGAWLGVSSCLTLLGALAASEGDLARATVCQTEALSLVRYTNDPKRIGSILRQLGAV